MTFKIAFCTNASVFLNNKILDKDYAKKFPGSEWVYHLSILARERGFELVTGDVALLNIQSNKWKASEILIIQEEIATQGKQLLALGAVPFLLLCLESPIYAREFYVKLFDLSKTFKNRILFKGTFNKTSSIGKNHIAYFPSFSEAEKKEIIEWDKRKFLVMVAANKYWKIIRPLHRQIMTWIRDVIFRKKSYLTTDLIAQQLHDKRLELIEFYGEKNNIDLYGGGWGNLMNLPGNWQKRLGEIVKNLNPQRCEDKHEIISNYKFNLCFENMSYPGYVTEKIIDCFSVGVIPIYMGAPDISDFVPRNLYIDLRDFSDNEELGLYLKNMTSESALEMINEGRKFLDSDAGLNFSFEGFAKKVLNLALNEK